MTPRFKRAYDLLVKAYFEGTLNAGDCSACAVGNICGSPDWRRLFYTSSGLQRYTPNSNIVPQGYVDGLEKSTGYSIKELAKIEYTFETNTKIKKDFFWGYIIIENGSAIKCDATEQEILADQFNGLKAVVELMMQLDGIEGDQYVDKFKEKLITV